MNYSPQFLRLLMIGCLMATASLVTVTVQAGSEEAALAYTQGDYKGAYKAYLKSAKKGDAYAQYRVSFMMALGLGTDVDPVDAMAWAVVAEQNAGVLLAKYSAAVAALVPAKDRKKAQKRADYFLRRWGDEDSERRGGGLARASEGGCTGSRLSANCGASDGGGNYWIAWGQDLSDDPVQRDLIRQIDENLAEDSASWPGA